MREARSLRRRSGHSALYLAYGLMTAFGGSPVVAQSLDLGGGATAQEPPPSLDLNVNPSAPLAATPAVREDNLKAGIALRPLLQPDATTAQPGDGGTTTAAPPAEATPGNTATTEPAPAQPPAEPRKFEHPTVVDTARLKNGDTTVALFGIVGQQGEAAQALQAYIAQNGGQVACQPQPNAEYICRLPDNTDVADVSLVNGAAQTRSDSTDEYRAQEAEAQNARRGIWANLPPPPVQLKHPMVRDTATIVVEGKIYRLDGIEGLGGQYARDLQGYIAAHDDALMCQPQGNGDRYICVMPDGTDVAKEALVNGAAKVAPNSPDSYRLQQAEALDNKRGIWANVTLAAATSARVYTPSTVAVVPGDEADGITYVGGVPSVVIDGAPVFLTYAGALGWGYYDQWNHWQGAPAPFVAHMDQFHPGGVGLPGFQPVAMGPGFSGGPPFGGGPGGPGGGPGGPMHPGGFGGPGGPGGGPGGPMHPGGFAGPGGGYAHPGGPMGPGGGFGHPGGVGGPGGGGFAHLGGPGGGFGHPGGGFGGPGGGFVHPGSFGGGGFHGGGPGGGGFHPGGGVGGGFHPGGGGGGGFHPGGGGGGGHPGGGGGGGHHP
jgi:endonuclease YncB( thermonuclease family)